MPVASSEALSISSWALLRTNDVIAAVERVVAQHAQSEPQRLLLRTALSGIQVHADEMSRQNGACPLLPFVHLPLLVFASLTGDDQPAVPLAAATSLLYLGIDMFDDVADGDRPEHWGERSAAEVNLAAAMLLCSVPQLAIAELDVPADRVADMQRTLAAGLLLMSEGQLDDLLSAGASIAAADRVEQSVALKSGEELAMFARLGAQFAGASAELVDTFTDLGRSIGTAGQLSSDCHDLFGDPSSRDLAHGARTLPIALHLDRLEEADRARFLELLDEARTDEPARANVRAQLRSAGALRHCAFIVETHCQRALRLLNEARPSDLGRRGLRAMIENVTFFRGEAR